MPRRPTAEAAVRKARAQRGGGDRQVTAQRGGGDRQAQRRRPIAAAIGRPAMRVAQDDDRGGNDRAASTVATMIAAAIEARLKSRARPGRDVRVDNRDRAIDVRTVKVDVT